MPFYLFLWDEKTIEHVAEHGLSVDEFEEIVCDPDRVGRSRSSGRPIAFGVTTTGLFVACVYELVDETTVLPVTAYEVEG